MKNLYVFLLITFSTLYTQAQNQPFITTWEVNPGDLNITIPTYQSSVYNYTVDFGDGTVLNNQTGNVTHSYSTAGNYTVSITGTFPRIYFNGNWSGNFYGNILSIDQWGDIQWESMNSAFEGCQKLIITATDSPDLSQTTDLSQMFERCSNLNQSLNSWNVSNITNMNRMFYQATSFDQPLNNWNVSNVINMQNMFDDALSFNQDLSNWNFNTSVSLGYMIADTNLNITNYENLLDKFYNLNLTNKTLNAIGMYYCNTATRSNLINNRGWTIQFDYQDMNCGQILNPNAFTTKWLISSSGDKVYIPANGTGFNYNVDFGDGTILTNQTSSISHTYTSPGVYSVSITGNYPKFSFSGKHDLLSVEQWGSQQWTTMSYAFQNCYNLEINATDAPDLSQVINMNGMFKNCSNFNQSIDHWDVSNITEMSQLFYGTNQFNQSLNSWNVSNVTNMNLMFYGAKKFNQPLNGWNTTNVTNMNSIFSGANSFNQNINSWDTSNVTNMSEMFSMATSFNKPLSSWDTSNVISMSFMFRGATNFNQNIDNWDVSNVTTVIQMFMDASDFNQPLNSWDISSINSTNNMFLRAYSFNQPLGSWDTSNVTDMSHMFSEASSFNKNINNWDVSNVTNMFSMFGNAISFNQPLNSWNVSNIADMNSMFWGASLFNQDLNNWDISSLTSLNSVFKDAISYNQPINNWDVSNITDFGSTFEGASSFNQDISNWNVISGYNFSAMFLGASSFNQPLNNWNISNAYSLDKMLKDATSFNQPINNWNISGVNNISELFNNASSFNQDLSMLQFPHGGLGKVINNTGLDVINYDKFLNHLASSNLTNGYMEANNLSYCNITARDELINNLGWTITGDTQSQNCNSIVGNISYDENNNGCDPNDAGISGFMINANDGIDNLKTYSSYGDYQFGTTQNNFTVSVLNYPSYFSITPVTQQITFTTSNTEVADFCVTANQTIEDLNVVLIPTSEARPGFEADYQLVVENIGTQAVTNAIITLDFDDAMQSFVNAGVTPTSTTANQLTFDIANLQPLTFQTVDITMQTFQPPTVNGDDILSFTANVSPSMNDFTPNDNTFIYDQIVVNSYDPNDKQVLQGEEIEIDEADEYLNYLIRFQNTGTASAINVRILDTLHPKLDYSTLRPVNASHNYRIEVNNENEVEFIFDGINLPDENTNEPASHGFVAYKIKPKSDVAVGDFITGDANIYFDFNAPIITNMISTEIIDDLSSTNYGLENNISIYPNPTQNILHIEVKNNQEIEQIKIYNLSGLELMNVKENKQQLHLENLSAGVYFIQIQTNLGTVNRRFIKS